MIAKQMTENYFESNLLIAEEQEGFGQKRS